MAHWFTFRNPILWASLILLALLPLALTSCGIWPVANSPKNEGFYTNSTFGFSVRFPESMSAKDFEAADSPFFPKSRLFVRFCDDSRMATDSLYCRNAFDPGPGGASDERIIVYRKADNVSAKQWAKDQLRQSGIDSSNLQFQKLDIGETMGYMYSPPGGKQEWFVVFSSDNYFFRIAGPDKSKVREIAEGLSLEAGGDLTDRPFMRMLCHSIHSISI